MISTINYTELQLCKRHSSTWHNTATGQIHLYSNTIHRQTNTHALLLLQVLLTNHFLANAVAISKRVALRT